MTGFAGGGSAGVLTSAPKPTPVQEVPAAKSATKPDARKPEPENV